MIQALLAALLFQAPLVLSITNGDGRTARRIITATPTGAWTPMFPKSAQWRSPEGLAVTAINYRHVPEDGGVRVTISVCLGEAFAGRLRDITAQYARWHLRFIELTAR